MPYEQEIPPYGDLIEPPPEMDRLAHVVIGAAIEVHTALGPGLPEGAYERALVLELTSRQITVEQQKLVEIFYKGALVARGRIDLLVGGMLIVEVKAVDALLPVHRLQTLSYMKIINQPLGLLINFNVPTLKEGIKRIIASDLS